MWSDADYFVYESDYSDFTVADVIGDDEGKSLFAFRDEFAIGDI